MGFVGLGLWVMLWGLWYYQLIRARRRLHLVGSLQQASLLGWSLLAVTGLLVNGFLDGTIESPQVGVWVWCLFGLGSAVAMEANVREWQRRRGSAQWARKRA